MPTRYQRLSQDHRSTIHLMRKQGYSQAQIASAIGFHPSTVSRELSRNTGRRGYRPAQAVAAIRGAQGQPAQGT